MVEGGQTMSEAEATCSSAVKTAIDVGSPAIIVLTKTGAAARLISKYRPGVPILMGSTEEQVCRQANLVRGVVPFQNSVGPGGKPSVDDRIKEILKFAEGLGLTKPGDVVVTVYGKDGTSNMIKMITIPGSEQVSVSTLENTTYSQAALLLPRSMGDLSMAERTTDSFARKCKIICTMGPSCWSVENLVKLIDAGMNIARLNFSHGDHEGHGACLERIREADKLRPDKPVAILLDTKGPEIRTGFFKDGGKIKLKAGQDLKIVTDYDFKGDNTCFAVTYKTLPQAVKPGQIILCADGCLSLKVKTCGDDHLITEVMNDCSIGERKNCNLPGVKVDLPVLQDKDIDDLVNFGVKNQVHFVAASFVQSAADVQLIRDTLGEAGKNIKIIPKIENQEGLINFDEIVEAADGIMVARGDLGMEIPPEKVFLAQKVMIAKCNAVGKPVVTATQMLESMTAAPRPTRAEAGDVANAVLDGTDCVMLSGETAGGAFPVEAVTIMRRIVEEAESTLDYNSVYNKTRTDVLSASKVIDEAEATCSSAVKTAIDVGSPVIIVLTKTGAAARLISKYRPGVPILMGSTEEQVCRQGNLVRGVVAFQNSVGAAGK